MLKIDHISKTFYPGTENEKRALQDLSLTLDKGDFVTVIGSNGAENPPCSMPLPGCGLRMPEESILTGKM